MDGVRCFDWANIGFSGSCPRLVIHSYMPLVCCQTPTVGALGLAASEAPFGLAWNGPRLRGKETALSQLLQCLKIPHSLFERRSRRLPCSPPPSVGEAKCCVCGYVGSRKEFDQPGEEFSIEPAVTWRWGLVDVLSGPSPANYWPDLEIIVFWIVTPCGFVSIPSNSGFTCIVGGIGLGFFIRPIWTIRGVDIEKIKKLDLRWFES
jgi:hypothetical protein